MTDLQPPTTDPNYHPAFRVPPDRNAAIWRYRGFPKFTWMLLQSRLYMPCCDVLAKLDPFEGSTPAIRYKQMREAAEKAPAEQRMIILANIATLRKFTAYFKNLLFVSCWHMSEYESDAMWKLYGASNNCVAIRSSYGRLDECLRALPVQAWAGLVNYIDYNAQDFSFNMLQPVVHKRRAFEHEHEVRAVVLAPHMPGDDTSVFAANSDKLGYFPVVDLERLIECVYVSPLAQDWFLEAVNQIIRLTGHGLPLHRSEMAATPVF